MVTVTPFMGKVNVYILQFYINGNGEMKPGKSNITLELEEFEELVKFIPKVQDSLARYELRDIGIPSRPLELDLPVLYLDSSGSRPGHKVSGTRSKFPNLNENGQKSHFL